MRRALVVADTVLPPRIYWDDAAKHASLVVAADGGANRALEAGLRVDWVVGDLDGILPQTVSRLPKERVKLDTDRDSTDLEKVLRFLRRRRIDHATLIGVIGGRLDHTLGSLAVLSEWSERMHVEIVDEHFLTVVTRDRLEFRSPVGTMVSLFAPGGATGVTTKGLRYDLSAKSFGFSTLGIHNEVRRNPVRIRVSSGALFVMRAHYVKVHV